MPQSLILGTIKPASELGYINNNYNYILIECPECHKQRWVAMINGEPRRIRCHVCSSRFRRTIEADTRVPIPPNQLPEIGEIRHGYDFGKTTNAIQKYIYVKCPKCGNERWTSFRSSIVSSGLAKCHKCAIIERRWIFSSQWKGGVIKHVEGYRLVKLQPDNFFYPMCDVKGYVFEHRLVMAKSLNRCLLKWEIVHHKNGMRADNGLENLKLLPGREHHISDTLVKSIVVNLTNRIFYLEGLLKSNDIQFKASRYYLPKTKISVHPIDKPI